MAPGSSERRHKSLPAACRTHAWRWHRSGENLKQLPQTCVEPDHCRLRFLPPRPAQHDHPNSRTGKWNAMRGRARHIEVRILSVALLHKLNTRPKQPKACAASNPRPKPNPEPLPFSDTPVSFPDAFRARRPISESGQSRQTLTLNRQNPKLLALNRKP